MPGINDVVRVSATIRGGGVAVDAFGGGLIITTDATLPAGGNGKIAKFSSLAAVREVFGDTTSPALAAAAWFGVDPSPGRLWIGRWAHVDVATRLIGGTVSVGADAAPLNANNASFTVNGQTVSGLDLSGTDHDTYAEIATDIQTAIVALGGIFEGATFAFADNRFTLTLSGGNVITPEFGTATDENGMIVGTDISAALAMTTAAGAVYRQGHDAETLQGALAEFEEQLPGFYFLMLDSGVPAMFGAGASTARSLAAAAAGGRYQYAMLGSGDSVLTVNESDSELAVVSALGSGRAFGNWQRRPGHLAVGAAARMSAQDLSNGGRVVNPNLRELAGITPDEITDTQAEELTRKRINYYVNRLGRPGYTAGWTFDPDEWIDARMLVDWLAWELELAIFTLLSTEDLVPQTIAGMATLRETINAVMEKGVRSGGIAPGMVSSTVAGEIRSTTGNRSFNGFLSNGYLTHIGSLANQTQTDRVRRLAPPAIVWAKGSGAVNFVPIRLDLEQ